MTNKNNSPARADAVPAPEADAEYVLRLYVSGQTPRSILAIENMRRICAEHLSQRYSLEIIDIYKHPEVCEQQQILRPTPQNMALFRSLAARLTCRVPPTTTKWPSCGPNEGARLSL